MMRGLLWVTGILALLWGGYWVVGSRGVQNAAEAWLAAQDGSGLEARHEGLSVSGFPNRFDLTISGLDLADPAAGLRWQTPFVQIFAMTWKPWHLIAALPEEQRFSLPGQELTLKSTRLMGSLQLVPGTDLALNETVAEIEGAELVSTLGWRLAAERLIASTRADPAQRNAHRIGLSVKSFAPDPALAATLGLPEAAEDIHLDATLSFSAPIDRHASQTRPRLQALDLAAARLVWGDFKVFAKGSFTPDAAGLASGEIMIRVEGWRSLPPLLSALGVIAPDFAPVLARGLEVMARDGDDPNVLTVPLKAQDGRMSLGPLPLGPALAMN